MPNPNQPAHVSPPSHIPPSGTPVGQPSADELRRILKASQYGHVDGGIPTALVLSGGGAKGSFEAGALSYLTRDDIWDRLNVRIVCGTSVGAINALKIAESGRHGVKDLVSLYVSLQREEDMFLPQEWLKKVKKIAWNQFRVDLDSAEISEKRVRDKITSDLLYGLSKVEFGVFAVLTFGILPSTSLGEAETKFEKLGEIARLVRGASALYTLEPIEEKLRASVDFAEFGPQLSAYVKMRLAVISLEDANTWYVTEDAKLIKRHAQTPTDTWDLAQPNGMQSIGEALVQGTLASAAIPGIFEMRHLRGDLYRDGHFVDGGVRDVLPVRAALELGAKRVVAILASPIELAAEPAGSYHDANIASIGSRSLDILTTEIKANEVNPESGRWPADVERYVIYPEVEVHGTQEVNPGLISINMAYGYMRAYELTLKGMLNRDLGVLQANALWANTRAIMETRRAIWTIEHNCADGGPLLQIRPDWHPGRRIENKDVFEESIPPPRAIVFNKPILDILRQHKRNLLELVETRMRFVEHDPHALPLKFEGPPRLLHPSLTPKDWWTKWERHGTKPIFPEREWESYEQPVGFPAQPAIHRLEVAIIQFDDFYYRWDLWTVALPIDFDGKNYVFEPGLPVAPVPSPELLGVLG